MPIYVYRCSCCDHQQDVLQKISDPRLTVCPACGQETYEKQVTAAGFRLKGTGWYETDFRGGSSSTPSSEGGGTEASSAAGGAASGDTSGGGGSSGAATTGVAAPAAPTATPG